MIDLDKNRLIMNKNFIYMFLMIMLLFSCLKQHYASIEIVDDVKITGDSSFTIRAKVTNDGGSKIDYKGVCLSSVDSIPTIYDILIIDSSRNLNFLVEFTGLELSKKYYARPFVVNKKGISYGEVKSIEYDLSSNGGEVKGNYNCESLNGITSFYSGMNANGASWGVSGNGYSGSCWVAPEPNNYGELGTAIGKHYVQFNRDFEKQGYIEFWVNTYKAGYFNLIPRIKLNGVEIGSATMIGGQQSSSYWMKVRSPIIQAGNNTIIIWLSGDYYVLKIDEIEFFEY